MLYQIANTKKHKTGGEEITALYARLSRDDGDVGDSDSIVHQKEMLAEFAKKNNLGNTRYYVDDGFSGSNFDRPGFKQMLTDAENGDIRTIVVKDMSRFGRNHIMVGYYTDYVFQDLGIRFIAVNDDVDSTSGKDDDITPFRNILNEMYAKDCSRKIRAVLNAKGRNGKHLTVAPMFGYMKDPEDKTKWVIDEEAAVIVRRIFALALDGYGPYKIAEILTDDGVITPFLYHKAKGFPIRNARCKFPEIWTSTSIRQILHYEEYLGRTINFKTMSRSYRSRKRQSNAKENRLVFENTQEPIIDEQTFYAVQKVMESRHTDRVFFENNIFTGMLYCADCGERMSIRRLKRDRSKDYFTCSSYVKRKKSSCTRHKIPCSALEAIVRNDIAKTVSYVKSHEKEFRQKFLEKAARQVELSQKSDTKTLSEYLARDKEIDDIILKLYEDNVKGKISDERFSMMSAAFEKEQTEVKSKIKELKSALAKTNDEADKLNKFMLIVRQYLDVTELTPEILHSFVDRIYIGEVQEIDGKKTQSVRIIYNFVGAVDIPQ